MIDQNPDNHIKGIETRTYLYNDPRWDYPDFNEDQYNLFEGEIEMLMQDRIGNAARTSTTRKKTVSRGTARTCRTPYPPGVPDDDIDESDDEDEEE